MHNFAALFGGLLLGGLLLAVGACGSSGATPAGATSTPTSSTTTSSTTRRTASKTHEPTPVVAGVHPSAKVTKQTLDISPATMQIPGYLGGFAFLAAHDDGTMRVGWNTERDLHIAHLGANGERLGADYVRTGHVLTRMLTLPDGSLVIAVVPFQEHLFNAFRTALALDVIKLTPAGKEVYRTRITGGSGSGSGKVWHVYAATTSVRMAWNGTGLGVFTEVSRNFSKPGKDANTHQGDLFVVLDERGKILEDRTELWSASHSSMQRLTTGPNGEMLTVTVGDAYPFGIYYVNRDSKETSVVWPEESQRTPAIKKAIRSTTGAGTLCGVARLGDKLYASIDAARTLPNPDAKTHGDVMLVRFALDGTVEKTTWVTNTSGKRERCPNVVPYQGGLLLAWTDRAGEDDDRAVLAVVNGEGEILFAPQEVAGAQRQNYHSDVIRLPGGGAAWVETSFMSSEINVYKVAP